jgi:hypothetical protein
MYRHSLPPGYVQFISTWDDEETNNFSSFILKTKEQRAAEKALMDKSPLKTLTLEDFLESERHKLTGTLTPVTPESFAKWKKDRLDKKAAEDEARKAKEATGRAMFESGDWKGSDDEESSDEEEEQEEEDDAEEGNDAWNLEAMRAETERLRALKEEERLAKLNGGVVPDASSAGVNGVEEATDDAQAEDAG